METIDAVDRYGDFHDAVIEEVRIDTKGGAATVVLLAQPESGDTWDQVMVSVFECDEYRLSQGPHDNVVIFAARVVDAGGKAWLVLDASAADDGDDLTIDDCRSSSHYLRGSSISFEASPYVPREGA